MSEWISVNDDLPANKGWYLVNINNEVDVIDSCNKCQWNGNRFVDVIGFPPVTHWMPLPEPPK